jgi:pre-60S factor REI1
MDHMTAVHSFFIPDIEYLTNLHGLLTYLAHKISVENTCLFCNGKGKGFYSLEGVRKHMVCSLFSMILNYRILLKIDKGHMKIAYEDGADLEVADYYDFSSTWVDMGDMADKDADLQLVPHSGPNQMVISADSMEMTLPTGQKLYHRSLQRYLRQSFKPREQRESVIINKLAAQYRALGWYQSTAASISKEQKFIQRSERRARFEQVTKVGLKANGLQRHFREQIDY